MSLMHVENAQVLTMYLQASALHRPGHSEFMSKPWAESTTGLLRYLCRAVTTVVMATPFLRPIKQSSLLVVIAPTLFQLGRNRTHRAAHCH